MKDRLSQQIVKKISSNLVSKILMERPSYLFLRKNTQQKVNYDLNSLYIKPCEGVFSGRTYDIKFSHSEFLTKLSIVVGSGIGGLVSLKDSKLCITEDDPYSSSGEETQLYYYFRDKPLNKQLHEWEKINYWHRNILHRHFYKLIWNLFEPQTYMALGGHIFKSAIFSPGEISGQDLICREVNFRNLGGEEFTIEPFIICSDENPKDVAMKKASESMGGENINNFYFVNPEEDIFIVLYKE